MGSPPGVEDRTSSTAGKPLLKLLDTAEGIYLSENNRVTTNSTILSLIHTKLFLLTKENLTFKELHIDKRSKP